MRFAGTVLAVLLANLLTIALIAGAYIYLKSDHGQEILHQLGLHSLALSFAATSYKSGSEQGSSDAFVQPRISDMKPMKVPPRHTTKSQAQLQTQTTTKTQVQSATQKKNEASRTKRKNLTAINSSLEMCRFWNAEYKKDQSLQSEGYRDLACSRFEWLSGRDSSSFVNLAEAKPSKPSYQIRREREERKSEANRQAREQREHEEYCERVRERISHYDSLLRTGGKAHYVNRLRAERREISLEYSRVCLLGG